MAAPKNSSEAFLRAHVGHGGDDCVIWPYCRNSSGYGLAVVGGLQKAANRWMCILAHGEPPGGSYEAAHSCGNRPCVNPRHLRWATRSENQADREMHGTANRGERASNARLSTDDIRAIRIDTRPRRLIAEQYGISVGHIYRIRTGIQWWCV